MVYTSFWLEEWLRGGTKASALSVKKEMFIWDEKDETYYTIVLAAITTI